MALRDHIKRLQQFTGVLVLFISLDGDVTKLQHRLQLLREEYVKLQSRLSEVERQNSILVATSGNKKDGQSKEKNFVAEILKKISDLFNKETYRFDPQTWLNILKYLPRISVIANKFGRSRVVR